MALSLIERSAIVRSPSSSKSHLNVDQLDPSSNIKRGENALVCQTGNLCIIS
jgi:hypothetical protein